ncbi:MAG TPA: hypothetical protein VGG90_04445 [Candidatus Dormibacteraeota bacterium]
MTSGKRETGFGPPPGTPVASTGVTTPLAGTNPSTSDAPTPSPEIGTTQVSRVTSKMPSGT